MLPYGTVSRHVPGADVGLCSVRYYTGEVAPQCGSIISNRPVFSRPSCLKQLIAVLSAVKTFPGKFGTDLMVVRGISKWTPSQKSGGIP